MALLTLAQYYTFAGLTASSKDAQYQQMIDECIDAVLKYLNNGTIESSSYSLILPAPARPVLYFPHFPILKSSLQVWLNLNANGRDSYFTSEDLLVEGQDYVLQMGPNDALYSYTSRIDSLAGPFGSGFYVRPIYSLASRLQANPGSIKATYTAGWPTVPPSLQAAICLMVSRLYQMRKSGIFYTSSSWNGYSESGTAPLTLFNDPMIRGMLRPFGRGIAVGGYTGSL
jgi:hypothetical protein